MKTFQLTFVYSTDKQHVANGKLECQRDKQKCLKKHKLQKLQSFTQNKTHTLNLTEWESENSSQTIETYLLFSLLSSWAKSSGVTSDQISEKLFERERLLRNFQGLRGCSSNSTTQNQSWVTLIWWDIGVAWHNTRHKCFLFYFTFKPPPYVLHVKHATKIDFIFTM